MINSITIAGRLTHEPELRKTDSGTSITNITLANDTGYGEYQQTNFIRVVAWKGTAEAICNYAHKGQMLVVTGELRIREYTDKNGVKRDQAEINAQNVMLPPKSSTTSAAPAPAPSAWDQPKMQKQQALEAFPEQTPDSDLPF